MTQTLKASAIAEAIEALKLECVRMIETHDPVSARGTLIKLGYSELGKPTVTSILERIAEGGFSYCLDPSIPQEGEHADFPPLMACYWTPEQLLSRLNCLYW